MLTPVGFLRTIRLFDADTVCGSRAWRFGNNSRRWGAPSDIPLPPRDRVSGSARQGVAELTPGVRVFQTDRVARSNASGCADGGAAVQRDGDGEPGRPTSPFRPLQRRGARQIRPGAPRIHGELQAAHRTSEGTGGAPSHRRPSHSSRRPPHLR